MLRTPLNLAHQKRTIRPLYANTQATPKACLLLPATLASPPVDIYPGMVMMQVGRGGGSPALDGTVVDLVNATGSPYGLADFFEAPSLGIRQISDSGVNACAVWVLGPDAEFQVLAPAFDTSVDWTAPWTVTSGVPAPLYAVTAGANRGKLTPAAPAGAVKGAVAKLLSVNFISYVPAGSNTVVVPPNQDANKVIGSITIGGLSQSDHAVWA